MLFVAAFSDLVTTFQPKTWPKYIRNYICQTKLTIKSIRVVKISIESINNYISFIA